MDKSATAVPEGPGGHLFAVGSRVLVTMKGSSWTGKTGTIIAYVIRPHGRGYWVDMPVPLVGSIPQMFGEHELEPAPEEPEQGEA